jgi:hypothetical protein
MTENEVVIEDEATTEEDDISVQGLDYDRQEIIRMQADALDQYNKEAKANKETKVIMPLSNMKGHYLK